jgi:hypothetical protein
MVLGEPESFDMKSNKSRADEVSSLADFDLAQTWNDIPAPVKYGVPGALLALIVYLNLGSFGSGKADHESRAEAIIQAVTANNKSKFVAFSTPDSADAAGEMFDLLHGEVEKGQFGSDCTVSPSLYSGVPEKDGDIMMLVVVSKTSGTDPPLTVTVPLKRDGSAWLLEGNEGLKSAKGTGGKK